MTSLLRTASAIASVGLFLGSAAVASAQTTPPATPASAPQAVVVEADEPDFSLVNLPTTLPLPKGKSSFHLTHRFAGNLRDGSFADNLSNLFGLDNGASVGLEYRVGITDRLQGVFYRTSVDKTIQFSAHYDVVRQTDAMPLSISAIASIEGNINFGWHTQGRQADKAPALAAVVSRTFGQAAAIYVVPTFVHNTLVTGDVHRNTFMTGLGARVQIRPTLYLVGEITPRLAGYAPNTAEYGFGFEKRAGWHMFQLTFSNTSSTTFGQVARGGLPNTLYFGFNLGRKFL